MNKEDIPLNEIIAYKHQKTASVMVWTGVTSTGEKTPHIEERAKINQHVYLNMLKEQLVPWINASFRKSGITLQQYGAIPHTANFVQEWCKKNFCGFLDKEVMASIFTRFKSDGLHCLEYSGQQCLLVLSPKCYVIKS